MFEVLFFYLFAGIMLASAFMVVISKNPVYSVLFLILAFFNAAGLFVLIGAEFLAMLLVVVYVGAVAVLFLFVVMMLDINFALLWGALAFFMNFVPYIGSIIAAVPVVILALLDAGPGTALAAGAGFLAANMIVGNILEPRFTGQGLGLSTLVVFVSLVFWGWVFGPVGMFLSTPLTMLMKIALENDPRSRWISILLSSEAPPSPPRY